MTAPWRSRSLLARFGRFRRSTPSHPHAPEGADQESQRAPYTLTFAADELAYLRSLRFIKNDFVDFLSIFRFQLHFVDIRRDGDALFITAEGPLVHVMGFEIFVLYIVSELYTRRLGVGAQGLAVARERLDGKIQHIKGASRRERFPFEFFDFGLRRRYCAAWQDEYVEKLVEQLSEFRGTSNVYLAKKLGIPPIGTMAHEYLQAYQAFGSRLRDFQKAALEGWVQEYRGDLGDALTDVVGIDAFLRDLDLYFAKLFDGLRHDSGDPFSWGDKIIEHYGKLRINPETKRLVFSNALDFKRAFQLHHYFGNRVRTGFGIGTHLSNDTSAPALNLVMKMASCNGEPVAKISDDAGKTLCTDEVFLSYLRKVFQHPTPA